MKKWLFLLWLAVMGPLVAVSTFNLPVSTVVIDAGHGGGDPGAIGQILCEKEVTLNIALQLAKYLEAQSSLSVTLTRDDDSYLSLEERSQIAQTTNPGAGKSLLFISIHANSSPSEEASGYELLIKKSSHWVNFLNANSADWQMLRFATESGATLNKALNRQNLLLANSINNALTQAFPAAKNRGVKEQDIWVLNNSLNPAVLVEVAFISNVAEESLMAQPWWQTKMAHAIGAGILAYITDY
ncbi:MAG: N-acetylmuramoyl-L-alanine amidase [Sphaerochaetaceae bacterium]